MAFFKLLREMLFGPTSYPASWAEHLDRRDVLAFEEALTQALERRKLSYRKGDVVIVLETSPQARVLVPRLARRVLPEPRKRWARILDEELDAILASAGDSSEPESPAKPTRPAPRGPITPEQAFVDARLAAAVARYESAAGSQCHFDRPVVEWLDEELVRLRPEYDATDDSLVTMYGALLGECFVRSFDGAWVRVKGGGIAVKIEEHVLAVPWEKVQGLLSGDDGDRLYGFFDYIANNVVGHAFDGVTVIQ